MSINVRTGSILNWRNVIKNKYGLSTVFSGFLIHLTLGNLYSFGNIMTYMDSYMHARVSKDITYINFIWVNAVATGVQGLFMGLAGPLQNLIGSRFTCLLGSLIMSGGIALTYYTIQFSFGSVIFSYGFLVGFGISLAYVIPLSLGMRWFPKHKGLVTGVIVGGFGLGSLGSTVLQTDFLNPENIHINSSTGYFDDVALLDRVPNVFLLLSGVFLVLQLSGCILMFPIKISFDHVEEEQLLSSSDAITNESEINDYRIRGRDLNVKEAIRTKEFYIIWFIFLFNCISIGYVNAMSKSFGQTFILDDYFLARIVAFASLFNCVGRVVWGTIMDRTSFKVSMSIMTLSLATLLFTFTLTRHMGKIGYTLWVWAIFFCFSGTFSLIPTVTEKAFGSSKYPAIHGLLFSQQAVASIILSCINEYLLGYGYTTCFTAVAIFVLASAVLTLTLRKNL